MWRLVSIDKNISWRSKFCVNCLSLYPSSLENIRTRDCGHISPIEAQRTLLPWICRPRSFTFAPSQVNRLSKEKWGSTKSSREASSNQNAWSLEAKTMGHPTQITHVNERPHSQKHWLDIRLEKQQFSEKCFGYTEATSIELRPKSPRPETDGKTTFSETD